ncbi:MAG: N-formylglutamate amidohydrolase [Rhodospirillales bacterium]|nr:N-formylglutamate amidohydrolase [Rhodospirillales bacterium]
MDHTPKAVHDNDLAVLEVRLPAEHSIPLVFASPHSGCDYPAEFLASSVLDPVTLRRSEDSFVHDLFGAAASRGAPLIRALFPRAYVDPNREPYELDPAMFADPLPEYVNTRSPRVAAGLGTIARVVANGAQIYGRKLRFAEAEHRINTCYRPYHSRLQALVDATMRRFGCCVLVDCHSMPSSGRPMDEGRAPGGVDIVLGDCFGTSCASAVSEAAEKCLRERRYRVVRNAPYAGGFTTRHYGRPGIGVHALQVEINRRLYMDEIAFERGPGFRQLTDHITVLIDALAAIPREELLPP